MASGQATNRTNIELPQEVTNEILQKTQEESVIMRLARQIQLPGRGLQIPVIAGDPEPEWVSETGSKPVSNPTLSKKVMQAHKLAVIAPFSNEFRLQYLFQHNLVQLVDLYLFCKKVYLYI